MTMAFIVLTEKYTSARFGGAGNIKPLNPSVDQQDFAGTGEKTKDVPVIGVR